MKFRVIVVGLIKNKKGEYLLCKRPSDQGVYPGQWAIPAGGIEEGENMEEALHREIWEEVGLKIRNIKPLLFQDDLKEKLYKDGTKEKIYMIYLEFECMAVTTKIKLSSEFEEYAWVKQTRLNDYDLNEATRRTFKIMGLL